MTQKERLDKLMEDRKKNQTDLLVAIYQDASEDERAGRNCVAYIEKKKGNFSLGIKAVF